MHLPDIAGQSFIVRIWIERTLEEAGSVRWRGRIIHVPSGDWRTFDDVNAIADFVGLYLADMGVSTKPKHQRPNLCPGSPDQELDGE